MAGITGLAAYTAYQRLQAPTQLNYRVLPQPKALRHVPESLNSANEVSVECQRDLLSTD
ncbi:hypothetical protein E2C01_094958 [Portunus trituberculatus]|uniref:Uncharacterized protein n=1 Tax=Portunus trituberculatus TaxID=210409 RepID=A0A5B7K324_PORTR|nr:hypothetical protein [Portunus trituberculatus]